MTEPPGAEPDDLDPLLGRLPSLPSDEQSRGELLVRTTRILRRRRRARRLALCAALAACYVAGLFTVRWLWPVERVEERPSLVLEPSQPTSTGSGRPEAMAVPPVVVERNAAGNREHRRELYLAAGNRYLTENSDGPAALRCYREALDRGTEKDLTIAPEDDWLLMALKKDKQEEKNRAKNKS